MFFVLGYLWVILAALVAFIVVPDDAIQVSIVSIFLQSLYPLTSVKVYKKKNNRK